MRTQKESRWRFLHVRTCDSWNSSLTSAAQNHIQYWQVCVVISGKHCEAFPTFWNAGTKGLVCVFFLMQILNSQCSYFHINQAAWIIGKWHKCIPIPAFTGEKGGRRGWGWSKVSMLSSREESKESKVCLEQPSGWNGESNLGSWLWNHHTQSWYYAVLWKLSWFFFFFFLIQDHTLSLLLPSRCNQFLSFPRTEVEGKCIPHLPPIRSVQIDVESVSAHRL